MVIRRIPVATGITISAFLGTRPTVTAFWRQKNQFSLREDKLFIY